MADSCWVAPPHSDNMSTFSSSAIQTLTKRESGSIEPHKRGDGFDLFPLLVAFGKRASSKHKSKCFLHPESESRRLP